MEWNWDDSEYVVSLKQVDVSGFFCVVCISGSWPDGIFASDLCKLGWIEANQYVHNPQLCRKLGKTRFFQTMRTVSSSQLYDILTPDS